MKDLFDRLKSENFAVIEELVALRYQETVQLDFKLKENPASGELSPNDRRVLGKAISALANSAGGLVVYGIDARKDVDDVDAARDKIPISNLARFRSDVSTAVGQLLMPRHDGIDIWPIEDPNDASKGYLAIWVDRSDRRPHRCEAAGDKHYYKRAGDNSIMMEHYDVEDAFNRTAPAELKLVLSDILHPAGREIDRLLAFFLRSDDRISACAPYVWADNVTTGRPLPQADHMVLTASSQGTKHVFSSGAQVLVHPGMSILAFNFYIPITMKSDSKTYIDGQRPHEAVVAFDFGFGCQNARMKTGRFELRGGLLSDLVDESLPKGELIRRINEHCMHVHKPTY